jgi:5,10-methylenetetrahydromethanopterin reductase
MTPASGAPRRLGLALSNEVPISETVAMATQAEALGFSEVWLPESGHGRGMFTVAASIAAATQRIKLGIGIVNPFWRHPSVIAMEAAALDEASHGRVLLGLGAALWTLRALGEADARTDQPLTAMVEAIRLVRAMLGAGERPHSRVFPFRADAHLDFALPRTQVPIYVGAVNARMLDSAGVWADGVQLGAIVSPGYARWAWQQVVRGATGAGRDPRELDLVSNVLLSVDKDRRAARNAVRSVLAYYIHRVEAVVLSTSGADPEELERIRQTVRELGADAGAARISDSLIDTFAAAGNPDEVSLRLREYLDAGLRGVLAWHVIGPNPERALQLLATEVAPQVFDD